MQAIDAAETQQSKPAGGRDLLNTKKVKTRVGNVSDMCLWRWTRDPEVRFPAPDVVINGRKYWYDTTIDEWQTARAGKAA